MPGLPDGGDRIGGTLKALGDKPFWWVSPSGEERLLFWMAGRGYSWFHGLNMGRMTDRSRDDVLEYVKALADAGYPFDIVQVRYTIGGDNGPVDSSLPDAVKAWNEQFASPRLVINTADAMFAEFERKHGAQIPAMAGDMTPYWEDGALSSAAEEVMARASARRLVQAETLWAMRQPSAFPAADADEAWRNLILWHEHTWGAADSISQPERADVVAQWVYKRAFALEAGRRSLALLGGAAPAPGGAIEVLNTLSWPRSGLVFLPAAQSAAGDRVRTAGQPHAAVAAAEGRPPRGVGRERAGPRRRPAAGRARARPRRRRPRCARRRARWTTGGCCCSSIRRGGTVARLVWRGQSDRRPSFGPAVAPEPDWPARQAELDGHRSHLAVGGQRPRDAAERGAAVPVSLRLRPRSVAGRRRVRRRHRRPPTSVRSCSIIELDGRGPRHERDSPHAPRGGGVGHAGDGRRDRQDRRARQGERAPGVSAERAWRRHARRSRRSDGRTRAQPASRFVPRLHRRAQRGGHLKRRRRRLDRDARRAAAGTGRDHGRTPERSRHAELARAHGPGHDRLRVPLQ